MTKGHSVSSEIEKGQVGETVDDFLKAQGTYAKTAKAAAKRVLDFKRSTKTVKAEVSSKKD